MGQIAGNGQTVTCSAGERLLVAILFAVLVGVSFLPLRPPGTDEADFPTEPARAFVADISRAPHPVGSDEHRRVEGLIEQRIRQAGVEPVVQEDVVVEPVGTGGLVRVAYVRNVLARLAGSDSTGAVLLDAHYDSKQTSPGASDDGAAVAALLGTLDELARGPAPRNDVIFLFSDAEETGLLGARAFAEDHPWAHDVRLVLNFEARGTEGPSLMFETGPGTGSLVGDFAAAARHPVAASYGYDVYRFLPNDTDLSVFKQAGLPGFNFAFIGGARRYHSQLDSFAALDPRSLAHHGENALLLARHFAAADLSGGPWGAPRTYFDLPFAGLIVYPTALSLWLAVAALLLTGWLVWSLRSRGELAWGRLLIGLAALLGVVAVPTLVVFGVDWLLLDAGGLSIEKLHGPGPFLAGEIVLALALAVLLLQLALRRLGRPGVGAAAALLAGLAALAAALALPSSSYLLAWPALGASVALWLSERRRGAGLCLLLLLPALPVLLLWPPTLALVGQAFGLGEGFLLALLAAVAAVLLAVLLARLAAGRAGRWAALALAAAGIVVLVVTGLGAGYDAQRPEETSLLFLQDAQAGEAWWATMQLPVDPWAAQILGDRREDKPLYPFLGGSAMATMAPAPPLAVDPPRVELVEDRPADGGGRWLHLHAVSPRGAPVLRLELESEAATSRLTVAGREVPVAGAGADGADWYLIVYALPPAGIDVEIELAGDAPLSTTIIDQGYDLTRLPGVPPRGEGRIPNRVLPTDLTVVRGGTQTFAPPPAQPSVTPASVTPASVTPAPVTPAPAG